MSKIQFYECENRTGIVPPTRDEIRRWGTDGSISGRTLRKKRMELEQINLRAAQLVAPAKPVIKTTATKVMATAKPKPTDAELAKLRDDLKRLEEKFKGR